MSTVRRSNLRSRIVISPQPPGALAEPIQEPPEAPLSQLDGGIPATSIYRRPGLHFFARLLSDLPLDQVYCWEVSDEADEELVDELEDGLFALHWNGKDLLDTEITLSELQREVRVNDIRVNPMSGHRLVDGDKIKVDPPSSAPDASSVKSSGSDSLTYKFDALFIPGRDEPDRTPYKVLRQLGEGSFGIVAQVRHTVNQQFYAIKTVKAAHCEREEALREPLLWRDLIHECVCQYSRHWIEEVADQEEAIIYTVMGYAPFGNFHNFINANHKRQGGLPSDMVSRRVASQVCRAFDYLHGEGIAHCDFKPDNVVIERLDADGNPEQVAIIDFGLALRDGHLDELKAAVEQYRAPEIGLKDAKMTLEVDSFAIAATLHFFVTSGRELVEDPLEAETGGGGSELATAIQDTNSQDTSTQCSVTSGDEFDELVEDSESLESGDSVTIGSQDTDSQETNTQSSITSGNELDEGSASVGNGDNGSGLAVPNQGFDAEEKNKARIMHLEHLDFNEILKDFIRCMSLEDPEERMTAREALSHHWLQPHASPEPYSGTIEEVESEDAEVDELDSEGAEVDERAAAKRTRSRRSLPPYQMTSQGRYDPRARLDSEEGRM
ncbi:kinase-like protein [Peniophora sp. CONT]|nr:kinase-like protein [Peniophora sp. CONT]